MPMMMASLNDVSADCRGGDGDVVMAAMLKTVILAFQHAAIYFLRLCLDATISGILKVNGTLATAIATVWYVLSDLACALLCVILLPSAFAQALDCKRGAVVS